MSYKVKYFIGGEQHGIIKEMDENNLNEYWQRLKDEGNDNVDFREFDTPEEKNAFIEGLNVHAGWDEIYVLHE